MHPAIQPTLPATRLSFFSCVMPQSVGISSISATMSVHLMMTPSHSMLLPSCAFIQLLSRPRHIRNKSTKKSDLFRL